MSSITVNVSDLTLANVGHGLAERQFARALADFVAALREQEETLDEGGAYKLVENCLVGEISVKVQIRHSLENGATSVAVETAAKLPSRKGRAHPVHIHGDQVLVEPEQAQPLLVSSSKRRNHEQE